MNHSSITPDLSSIVWRAPELIDALGGLRGDTVLEYFSQSPFFDRQSTNAALKMQSQFHDFGDPREALKRMRGVEFAIHSEAPEMFVIAKQERENYEDVKLIALYFIMNGNIYLAPSIHSIVTSRLVNATHLLKTAIDLIDITVPTSKEVEQVPKDVQLMRKALYATPIP